MGMSSTALLIEQAKIVQGLGPGTIGTVDYVSMKNASRCCILLSVKTGVSPVASAITLTQATDVSNTGGKTLGFTRAFRSINTGPGGNNDVLTEFTVSSNTFSTENTVGTEHLYAIEINDTDLDVAGNFDCLRLNAAAGTNTSISALYVLYPPKYGKTSLPSSIAD